MTADHQNKPRGPVFSVAEARARAQAAIRKSDFILSRAYGLMREPKKEWEQIRAEETTVANILIGYVAPLAALPIVCDLIGQSMFAHALQLDFGQSLIRAMITWLISIGIVFFLGIVVNVAAESFEAEKNDLAAQKIAAYSYTPAFLSGVLLLWPPLGWLPLVALAWGVFIMFRGLPVLMRAPQESSPGYAATVTIAAMIGTIVLLAVAAAVS
jgi:hypothetical protein